MLCYAVQAVLILELVEAFNIRLTDGVDGVGVDGVVEAEEVPASMATPSEEKLTAAMGELSALCTRLGMLSSSWPRA